MYSQQNQLVQYHPLTRCLLAFILLIPLFTVTSCTNKVTSYTTLCANTFETGETIDEKRVSARVGTTLGQVFQASLTYFDSTEYGGTEYVETDTDYHDRIVLLTSGLRICPINHLEFGIDGFSPVFPLAALSNYHGLVKIRLTPTGSPFALSMLGAAGFCDGTNSEEEWNDHRISISSDLNFFEFRIPMSYRYPNDRVVFFGPYMMQGHFDVESKAESSEFLHDQAVSHYLIVPGFSLGVQTERVAHEITAVLVKERVAVQYGFVLKF